MSLSELNIAESANRGAVLTVLHPVDRTPILRADKSPITITLLGMDSDEFIRAERRSRQATREAMVKRQKYSAADDDRQADATLAACTVSWSGIPAAWLSGDGTDESPVDFSHDAALKLYANPGVRWLRSQVDEFIAERANFIKASPQS